MPPKIPETPVADLAERLARLLDTPAQVRLVSLALEIAHTRGVAFGACRVADHASRRIGEITERLRETIRASITAMPQTDVYSPMDSMDVSRPPDEPQKDEIEDRDDAAYSAWEERDYYNSIPLGYDRGPR